MKNEIYEPFTQNNKISMFPLWEKKRKEKKAHDYRLSVKVICILKMSCVSQYVGQQKQPWIPHASNPFKKQDEIQARTDTQFNTVL